jgi:hypothetical protein
MTTATITPLPTAKVITVPRLDATRRKVLLSRLAADVIAEPGRLAATDVAVLLAAYADDSLHGDRLADAWQEYLEAVRLEQDTGDGTVSPAEVCPEVVNGDRSEAAREMTRYAARDALAVLVNGNQIGGTA